MLKKQSHRGILLLLIGLAFMCGTATTAHAQLRAASLDLMGDRITCSVANTNYQLTPDKARLRFKGLSSETQEAFDKVTRHTELRTNIYTAPVTERINMEICPGAVNYIAYNADWLLNLHNNASGGWALYTIIAHEIGHYILAHDRRSAGSTPKVELEADEYAGEVLAKMGATLNEAQSAYRSDKMQGRSIGGTHPPPDQRLKAVERGWSKIRGSAPLNKTASEERELSADCANCIRPGPVELKNTVYKGGLNNEDELKFKFAPVRGNTDTYLRTFTVEVMGRPGTHVWDNKIYYWDGGKSGDDLLLAWRNLSKGKQGWVVVQHNKGRWFYKSNSDNGEWKILEPGKLQILQWNSLGKIIKISLKAPILSDVWKAEEVQYSFGYSM